MANGRPQPHGTVTKMVRGKEVTRNKSQKDWVKEMLEYQGHIRRNECLSVFITRLAAIIKQLKNEGYTFETKEIPSGRVVWSGMDTLYTCTYNPDVAAKEAKKAAMPAN